MIRRQRASRSGVAATELAILLPLLAVLFVIAVDWSRIVYYSVVIEHSARNGALWASDPYSGVVSPYPDMTTAALADAGGITPTPTVTQTNGTDAATGYPYVECTVTYNFTTVSNFPLIPSSTTLTRTVRMYITPQVP
jgi:Flp pilus assembly protein TadG